MTTKTHKFRITDETWEQFKKQCTIDGTDCSNKIREMINDYIHHEIIDSTETIKLVNKVYERTGRVTFELIKRNTHGQSEYENVINYCKSHDIPVIELYTEVPVVHDYRTDLEVHIIN